MTEPRPMEEIVRERLTYGELLRLTEGHGTSEVYEAITAERQRAEAAARERDEARANLESTDFMYRFGLARIAALEAALLNVIGSSFEFDDARIGYVTLQVDRGDIGHARALLDTKQAS